MASDLGRVNISHAVLGGGAYSNADEWLDAAGMGSGGKDVDAADEVRQTGACTVHRQFFLR